MMKLYILGIILLSAICVGAKKKFEKEDCEVCVSAIEEFEQKYLTDEIRADTKLIEEEFKKYCRTFKPHDKQSSLCYNLGGLDTSATGILGSLSAPLKSWYPALKICEKLKKLDSQICDLKFEKEIDLSTVDLKKMKVLELKKILNRWDETCEGCIEKSDFVRRIEELKPKYTKEKKEEL